MSNEVWDDAIVDLLVRMPLHAKRARFPKPAANVMPEAIQATGLLGGHELWHMRRRDAKDGQGGRAGWRLTLSAALSLALHAGLLVAAADFMLSEFEAPQLLPVSLTVSGGAGTAVGGGNAEALGEHSNGESAPGAPPRRANRRMRVAPKQRPAVVQKEKREDTPPRNTQSEKQGPLLDNAGRNAASTTESMTGIGGAGRGRGNGRGDSVGPGVGKGMGTGHGIGSGSGNGIDLRLACVYCPSPRYPRRALARRAEGTVDVWFSLAPDGVVQEATVRRSSGHRDLDRAAVDVARRSRFRLPAASGVRSARGYLEYRFRLSDE